MRNEGREALSESQIRPSSRGGASNVTQLQRNARERVTSPDEETAPAPPAVSERASLPDQFDTLVDSTPPQGIRPTETLADSSPPARLNTPKPSLPPTRHPTPKLPLLGEDPHAPVIEETGPVSVSTLFPVPYWDRYEAIAPIGEGGMGTVYKARDPRLNRIVAIKFIRGNDPRLVDRFFREARAQARIDHPNVCKVFEVGEVLEHPYIAMEFVDGKPLDLMGRRLGLEQKLRQIRDVALGLHAAHRIGLIHRDIKPANILVGRTPDGDLHASVVDFGLARETAELEQQTIFGIQGTPAYMSPEQAAGDMRALDRRTDVYGLGATLYELLTGQPPFLGKTLYELIGRITTDPPKPPRELDKRIPADVEIIVLRCLEKDPSHRYDSAKAFADDLDRYLEGEPIHAKPISLWRQIRSKAKKNKLIASLIGLSVVACLSLIGVSVRARVLAGEQAKLTQEVSAMAQEFGQDVKEMELFMRYAYALPLHNITREKNVVRTRMKNIEQKMSAADPRLQGLIAGPGHFALGKGYMALQEPKQALEHFLSAQQNKYDSPALFNELGKVYGTLYQQGIDQLQHIEDTQTRSILAKELEKTYLAPARMNLRIAASRSSEADSYMAALAEFYEQHYAIALMQAELAAQETPWLYDVAVLQGQIYFAQASRYHENGQTDAALAAYRKSIDWYEKASEMASSDPSVHEGAAQTWAQLMQVEEHRGIDITSDFQRLIEHCEEAVAAEPAMGSAFAIKALAFAFLGTRLLRLGEDPREALKTSIEAGEKALENHGPESAAYRVIGMSYGLIANYEIFISMDAKASLDESILNLEKANALDSRSSWIWNDLAVAYAIRGDNAAMRGDDPRQDLELAAQYFEQSIGINPSNMAPYGNRAWIQCQIAQYELDHGNDVITHLVEGFGSLGYVISMTPTQMQAWNNMGLAHTLMARYESESGEDPSASLERALNAFTMASDLSPDDIEAKQGKVNVYLAQAKNALDHNENPSPNLQRAREFLDALFKGQPDNTTTLLALAEHQRLLGVFAAKNKQPAVKFFESAERYLQTPLTKGASNIHLLRALAGLYETWAQVNVEYKKSPSRAIREGLKQIAAARAKNPSLPALDVMEGALYLAQAQAETKDKDTQRKSAELAHAALRKGLMGNSFLRQAYEPLLMKALALKEASPP